MNIPTHCECGKALEPISAEEYEQYTAEFGDTPYTCYDCDIETLECSGWVPEDFVKFMPELARHKQNSIAKQIIVAKRPCRRIADIIRNLAWMIKDSQDLYNHFSSSPFGKHKCEQITKHIDEGMELMTIYQARIADSRQKIYELIELYDRYGQSTPNEYAAILSTSHVHVERAIETDGTNRLLTLILARVENAAYTEGKTGNMPLYLAVSLTMIRGLCMDQIDISSIIKPDSPTLSIVK